MPAVEDECGICLGYVNDAVRLCSDCNEAFCQGCMAKYIKTKVSDACHGSCPAIACPSVVHAKRKKLLLFHEWSKIVEDSVRERYCQLAENLLAIHCPRCHSISCQGEEYDPSQSREFVNTSGSEGTGAYDADVASFSVGDLNMDEFYQRLLHVHCPSLQVEADDDAWKVFSMILRTIHEPERRSNLHLRYLRDRPHIHSKCCRIEYCFSCATQGFHEGTTCREIRAELDNQMVLCPSCGIALVFSEGCFSVQCLCGAQLNWEDELKKIDESEHFRVMFPENTHEACANVLCSRQIALESPDLVPLASIWRDVHRIQVNQALLRWFQVHYGPHHSQVCLSLEKEANLPVGIVHAISLWRSQHPEDFQGREGLHERMIQSLFLTMHPYAAERAMAARRFLQSKAYSLPYHDLMYRSVEQWIESHRQEYDQSAEEIMQRSAQQLIVLFGHHRLHSLRWLEAVRDDNEVGVVDPVSSLAHFDALNDSRNQSIPVVVPYSAVNQARWIAFVKQLDMLLVVLDADNDENDAEEGKDADFAAFFPGNGSQWLQYCEDESMDDPEEDARCAVAGLREFLRIRCEGTAGSWYALAVLRSLPLSLVVDALAWLWYHRDDMMDDRDDEDEDEDEDDAEDDVEGDVDDVEDDVDDDVDDDVEEDDVEGDDENYPEAD